MSTGISSLVSICARRVKSQFLGRTASVILQQKRHLQVHEYVSYMLLNEAQIPTPPFGVAKTPDEAAKIAKELGSKDLVLKAQVLTGGRGKGHFEGSDVGGVRMCDSAEEVKKLASKMLGKRLITKQTGAQGRICNQVMITKRLFPRKEFYMAILLDRTHNGPVIIVSRQGGVNIEEVAASNPDAVSYLPIDITKGLTVEQADSIAEKLGLQGEGKEVTSIIVCNMYELFIEKDALMVEINPYAEDITGNYFALDCKCNFDDSAKYRQKELFAHQDMSQLEDYELISKKFQFNYIPLDGNIGCMVNGAGLAMATMDIINLFGGKPANFLDVSGGANTEAITEAFKLISADKRVRVIFVNIFGGILRCDLIAEGIIAASKQLELTIPIIARLQGTNMEKAKEMIKASKLQIISIDELAKAAEASVNLALMMQLAADLNLKLTYTPIDDSNKCSKQSRKKK